MHSEPYSSFKKFVEVEVVAHGEDMQKIKLDKKIALCAKTKEGKRYGYVVTPTSGLTQEYRGFGRWTVNFYAKDILGVAKDE